MVGGPPKAPGPAALLPTTSSGLLIPAPKGRPGHQSQPASSPAVLFPARGVEDRLHLYAFGAQGPEPAYLKR